MASIRNRPLSRGLYWTAAGLYWVAAGAVLLGAAGAAGAAGGASLRLCSRVGGIRLSRVDGGLQVEYLKGKGYPFILRGWALSAARPRGEGVCITLIRRAPPPGRKILRARDDVFETGGPFQKKVIYRRTQRVIDLGGERVTVESVEILPRGQSGKRTSKEPK